MTDMDEEKEVASHEWADRVAMALLICLLVVLLVTGIHTCKAYGEENKPAVNLVLQFSTPSGGILKGLMAHYLINNHSIEIRDDAKYTVIILQHKESIYQGIMNGAQPFMFISGVVLGEATTQGYIKGAFTTMCSWKLDMNKEKGAKKSADAIAVIIVRLLEGVSYDRLAYEIDH